MRYWVAVLACLTLAQSASALTLADIKNRVRWDVVGDSTYTDDPLTDNQLNAWINDGQALIVGIARCIEKDTTITTVDQQVDYDLPSDFHRARGIITPPLQNKEDLSSGIRSATGETPTTIGRRNKETGVTEQYLDWGSVSPTLWVDPPPFGAYSIRVLYSADAAPIYEDSMECRLPYHYEVPLIEFVNAKAFRSLSMYSQSATAEQKFLGWMQLLMQQSTIRQREGRSDVQP